ncbi:MAG: hypothetical protein R2685_11320 [Candidatus Nitrosocosmicus sp.]|nr:hypothetical protein [Candidatus Nitrosocosmicus sp.]
MTSTKIFPAKKTSILVVAVFTLAFTIGMGPISSSMAVGDSINCNTKGDSDSSDGKTNTVTTCHKEASNGADDSDDKSSAAAAASTSNDDEDDEDQADNDVGNNVDLVKGTPQNIASNAPAFASPPDNIIKPINLNKGFTSDTPLETNNLNHVTSSGDDDDGSEDKIHSKKVIEDKMPGFNNKLDKSSTSVSELYESFNLPYTALYN